MRQPSLCFFLYLCTVKCHACHVSKNQGRIKGSGKNQFTIWKHKWLVVLSLFQKQKIGLEEVLLQKIVFLSTMLLNYPYDPCQPRPPATSNFTTLHYNNLERSDVQKIAFNDSFALMSGPAF